MNSHELPMKSENDTINKVTLLQEALFFAFERTKSEPFDVSALIKDVLTEFPNVDINKIITALRNGGLGKYGRTFRLSTQEVCFWIREYLKPIKQDRL